MAVISLLVYQGIYCIFELHPFDCNQSFGESSVYFNNVNTFIVRTEDIPAITVFSNHKAVFTCLTRDGSILSWRVNGTDIDNLPSALHDDIVTSSVTSAGHHLFTLTILGRVEYNGTIIQCVAGIEGGKNKTIILHIQGV